MFTARKNKRYIYLKELPVFPCVGQLCYMVLLQIFRHCRSLPMYLSVCLTLTLSVCLSVCLFYCILFYSYLILSYLSYLIYEFHILPTCQYLKHIGILKSGGKNSIWILYGKVADPYDRYFIPELSPFSNLFKLFELGL